MARTRWPPHLVSGSTRGRCAAHDVAGVGRSTSSPRSASGPPSPPLVFSKAPEEDDTDSHGHDEGDDHREELSHYACLLGLRVSHQARVYLHGRLLVVSSDATVHDRVVTGSASRTPNAGSGAIGYVAPSVVLSASAAESRVPADEFRTARPSCRVRADRSLTWALCGAEGRFRDGPLSARA